MKSSGQQTSRPLFDNTEQRPTPLAGATSLPAAVDTRPHDYGIPVQEQDHDAGRHVFPQDGQEVVELLDRRGSEVGDDIGTLPEGPPLFDDVWA